MNQSEKKKIEKEVLSLRNKQDKIFQNTDRLSKATNADLKTYDKNRSRIKMLQDSLVEEGANLK